MEVMKIMEFLSKKAIITDLKSIKKEDILRELVEALIASGEVDKRHRNKIIDGLMARETLGSTAIGQGVGIPHAKSDCVKNLIASFGLSRKGVNFDSLDAEPVYIDSNHSHRLLQKRLVALTPYLPLALSLGDFSHLPSLLANDDAFLQKTAYTMPDKNRQTYTLQNI